MQKSDDFLVTFPVSNGIYGVNLIAEGLDALAADGRIAGWHPGRWTDWTHTEIQIVFDTAEDATMAKRTCLDLAH